MKKYNVVIFAPAASAVEVTASTEDEAIRKAQAMAELGAELDFTIEIEDEDDAEYIAYESEDGDCSDEDSSSDLKNYVVMLEATSYKEVPVKAVSPEAAAQLVSEMYGNTDVIDFNDGDVISIKGDVRLDEDFLN